MFRNQEFYSFPIARGAIARRFAGTSMAVLAAAMLSGTAHAQTVTTTATATTQPAEIVVTAQKRNERIQDVPISITVIQPDLLKSTNARNFVELSGAVPGVMFNGNGGGVAAIISRCAAPQALRSTPVTSQSRSMSTTFMSPAD